jgi:hypothetical protein
MLLGVINAEYLQDYEIKVTFNDCTSKIVDLKDELWGTIFEPLNNKDYFKHFEIVCNTISWENGADFAPEFLYEIGK